MKPSQADVEAMIGHGARITGEFRWRPAGKLRWKAELPLQGTYEGARVKLTGTYNERGRNLSYSLIWGASRVRGLDVDGPAHPNPNGELIPTPHKHRWTDEHDEREAYRPTDIRLEGIEGILYDFLAECNIEFAGVYFPPHRQGDLCP